MSFGALPRLFRHEAASGIVLMLALALALVLANSRWPGSTMCCSTSRAVHIGEFGIEKPLLLWVNAGLAFADLSLSSIVEPVPLGIAAGLFLGKQTGVLARRRR